VIGTLRAVNRGLQHERQQQARPVHPAAAGTVAVLDGQVVARQRQQQAQGAQIDGARVLDLTRRYLAHYVAFPNEASLTAAVAWIAHAVARDRDDTGIGQLIWRVSPRLAVTSRKRGSGKSTLLDLIAILTRSRDGKMPKVTPRAIAETVGRHFDVAVLDEAKTIFGSGAKNLELQGCILAGYTPRTSYRVSGKSIPLFGAVAYAAKDELITDTNGEQIGDLLERSVILRFCAPDKAPPEVDEIAEDDGDLLASALIAWTDSCRDELRQAARDIAAEDRESDRGGSLRSMQIWRPLRALCRVADGLTAEELAEGKRGPWETAIDEASWELTAGAAGVEAQETLDELSRRAEAWGAPEDEPGVIEYEPGGDEDEIAGAL
jgi:energy-coupling factor transporter ATP-binding protein EcfA2